jgi:hypothetical protein
VFCSIFLGKPKRKTQPIVIILIRFSYLVLLFNFINQNNLQNTTKHNNIIIREKVQASFLERERGVYLVLEMLLSSQRSWRQLPQHADKPHFSSFIICSSTCESKPWSCFYIYDPRLRVVQNHRSEIRPLFDKSIICKLSTLLS